MVDMSNVFNYWYCVYIVLPAWRSRILGKIIFRFGNLRLNQLNTNKTWRNTWPKLFNAFMIVRGKLHESIELEIIRIATELNFCYHKDYFSWITANIQCQRNAGEI